MATLDQSQVEQWIASNGGAQGLQYGVEKKSVRNPEFDPITNAMAPPFVDIEVEVWRNPTTKAVLTVRRDPSGTFEQIENVGPQPASATTPTRTPEQTRADAANAAKAEQDAKTEAALNEEREYNRAAGRGYITHAEYQIQNDKKTAEARAAGNQAEANRLAQERLAFDRDKANQPETKTDVVEIGGKRYIQTVSIPKNGSAPTVRMYGPDGKPIDRLPSEGEATAGGPAMPTIVVGAAEQALTQYHTALANDPRLTPAQREKRFQEAVQTATIAANEAATAQRDRESQRNADVNVATTKLNAMQGGLKDALSFVMDLNGKLPEGSDLGGKAFAALVGINLLNMQQSGINSVGSAGTTAGGAPGQPKPAAVPTLTPNELTNPALLEARRQQIFANPVFRPAPPVDPSVTAATPGEPPDRANIPPSPATPSVSAGALAAPPPTAGEPGGPPLAPGPVWEPPAPSGISDPRDAGVVPPATVPAAAPLPHEMTPPPGSDPSAPLPWLTPPHPEAGTTPPVNMDPSQGPVGMAPDQMPAALAAFRPMAPVGQPMQQPAAPGAPLPPAVMRAQIAAKRPWDLTPEEYEFAIANGLEEDARRVPGMVA